MFYVLVIHSFTHRKYPSRQIMYCYISKVLVILESNIVLIRNISFEIKILRIHLQSSKEIFLNNVVAVLEAF